MLSRLLGKFDSVEVHHEYLCTHLQPLAVKYYWGTASRAEVREALSRGHGTAVFYSSSPLWGDCSNKLSWVIEPLLDLFPSARFVHLVRDGRKVVSSFLHKLPAEVYADEDTKTLWRYLEKPDAYPEPPPEKRYWWNIPPPGNPFYDLFRDFNRCQRLSFHWMEVNRVILRQLNRLQNDQHRMIRLEDLVSSTDEQTRLLEFLGLEYQPWVTEALRRPKNVGFPRDFLLTSQQQKEFAAIADPMMRILGYSGKPEYRVVYHPEEKTDR